MQNVDDIFSLWPTDADLGRDIGVSYPTVAAWKRRHSIPSTYWRALILAAARRGHPELTADRLADLHAAAPTLGDLGKGSTAFQDDIEPQREMHAGTGGTGQFSRFRHLRRARFSSADDIVDHVRALREEWERR